MVSILARLGMASTLTLVNLSDRPLKDVAVPLPVERLYQVLKVDFGKPLKFVDSSGRTLPCQLDKENNAVLVLADLPAGGRTKVEVSPAWEWPGVLKAKASWDEKAERGELTNGLIVVRLDKGSISLFLPDGRSVIEGLNFYGWLTEEPIPVPSPGWASEKGLLHLSTSEFDSLKAEVKSEGPVRAEILLTKEARGKVVYHEKLSLYPTRPVVEYWLEVENLADNPRWIADCDGIICSRWGEAMKGGKVLVLPTKASYPITGPWFGVGKEQIPPEERTWVVVHCEGGPSLGIVNLTKHTYHWCFTGDAFYLYQAGPDGERPIKIPPKGRVSFGVAFTILPREQAFEETRAVFRAMGRRLFPTVFVKAPVSAFLDGEPFLGGRVACFKEDFLHPERWLVEGGRLGRGGRFVCEAEGAVASLPLEVVGERPLRLSLELDELKGRMGISLRQSEGEKVLSFEVPKAGRHDWDVDISGEAVLQIRLQGKGSEVKLRRLYLGPRPLPAPKLLSPLPEARITDVSSFFVWESVKGAEAYEVQLSRSPKFESPSTFMAPALAANKAVFFPEKPLPEGRWSWRVRAVGEGGAEGEWSEVRSLSVNSEHTSRPLSRPISRERPLFILHSPSEIDKAWASIPDDLKPYCALRVEVAERNLDFFEFCKLAQRSGAKVIIQCSGPRGGVYNEVYGDRYGRQSLADLELAFQNFPNVIGAIIVEQFFHHFSDPTSREYARRLLLLCAKYGRLFVWADGHWYERLTWLRLGAEHPEMLRLFSKYKPYVVVLHKMNCGYEPLTIHGSVFGLWLCDFVGNFGVEPEDWYWFEAGFGKLGESFGRGGGNRELMPPSFWGQMMVVGLASGGTCWCLEPYWGLWEPPRPDKLRWSAEKVVFPLIRAIVKWGVIPSRDEVLAEVKAGVRLVPEDFERRDEFFGPLTVLYRGTYGLRHPYELVPDSGRYYFIPLLPMICERFPSGLKVVKASDFKSSAEAKEFFDGLYPAFYEGDATVFRVGSLIVAMHSRENEDVVQKFSLPLRTGIVKALGGELGPQSYVVGKVEEEKLSLHVNGREERVTVLTLVCEGEPQVKVSPEAALEEKHRENGAVVLTVSHRFGAVEIEVRK